MTPCGLAMPGNVRSLKEVLELNANSFLAAATELREIQVIARSKDRSVIVDVSARQAFIAPHLDRLIVEFEKLNARLALISASRFRAINADISRAIDYDCVARCLFDIESRFADQLNDIKLFVLSEYESSLFRSVEDLMNFNGQSLTGFASMFPNASFEIEESAKCIALGRHTASVFHSMRAMEIGIKALSKFLGIPDPVKANDKNWGVMLGVIRSQIDAKWPKQGRLAGTQGALVDGLFASLDAVKNPWRNATMHVESIYAPHEALHIARCTGHFMMLLMSHCDEDGLPPIPPQPSAPLAAQP